MHPSIDLLRRVLKRLRASIGQPLERLLLGREPVTLISEDCWGGEFCRNAGLPYTTPLAGAFILPGDYLRFLENFRSPGAFHLRRIETSHPYPVGRTPYATIHFMHAKSWAEAAAAFARRTARINPDRTFFKIDFGKAGYTPHDIARWNKLALPNAIALIPPTRPLGCDFLQVHRGRAMKKWTHDGAGMFHLSRRTFDFHHWIRTGELRTPSWWRRVLNFLFWDALSPSGITSRFESALRPARCSAADSTAAAPAPHGTSPPCGARGECPVPRGS